MRKVVLLPLMLVLLLFACQKEVSTDLPSTTGPNDPKSISLAIKVWHGIRTNGNVPGTTLNPNAPILDTGFNNQTLLAIAGRYVIIKPEVSSGSVAGFYVQVQGAPDYFKVDYAKPRNIGGRLAGPKGSYSNGKSHRLFGMDSTGNSDSLIVIVLPQTIQPGRFCITYLAFDSSGNVSNSIGACIEVQSFGGDTSVSYLNGLWHNTQYKYDTSQTWYPVIVSDSTSRAPYTCVNGALTPFCPTTNCTFTIIANYIYTTYKSDITFGSNGGFKYDDDSEQMFLDWNQTTCSNLVYQTQTDTTDVYGGWSYNSSTNKLLLIFDLNAWGEPEPFVNEYTIEKVNNNLFYLHNATYGNSQKFER